MTTASPAQRQQARATGAVHRAERQLRDRREIHAPRKQPDQVKQPEIQARHGVVVVRIAQVQEAQQLLVDEEEPEEAVILARPAVQRPGEVRGIAKRRQDVPRGRNQQSDRRTPLNGCSRFQTFAENNCPVRNKIDDSRRRLGKPRRSGSSAAAQFPGWRQERTPTIADAAPPHRSRAGMPTCQRDGEREHHVGNQNAGEEKQANAGADHRPA